MIQYIDKAALMAEIEKIREHVIRLRYAVDANCIVTIRNACECLESSIDLFVNSIDTLEVKEGDLDKEYVCKDTFIEKACTYLKENRDHVKTEDNGIIGWIDDEFIEDFKTFMKGDEV